MQFNNPQILWALLLLLIPVIVHLFQLRRFKKTPFTNVKLLQSISIQTRKSNQLKKWLILCTRLLALAAIILAFAQPYIGSKSNNTSKNYIFYVDNSFSMQAKGDRGVLLERAIQDLISTLPKNQSVTVFTNDSEFVNQDLETIKNKLLKINYTYKQLTLNEITLKAKQLSNNTDNSNLVVISDFQSSIIDNIESLDSLPVNTQWVALSPKQNINFSIDSILLDSTDPITWHIQLFVSANKKTTAVIPVSLYNSDVLMAKSAVTFSNNNKGQTTFSIPAKAIIKGKFLIEDDALQYDNSLFFALNSPEQINVLSINEADDTFLRKIYADKQFNYSSYNYNNVDYNVLTNQQVIILNELKTIPQALSNILYNVFSEGCNLVIIPNSEADVKAYNTLLRQLNMPLLKNKIEAENNITTISFNHPLYKGVFEKSVKNFQYPNVLSYWALTSNRESTPLIFQNNRPFLAVKNNCFLFTASLQNKYSNFTQSALVVPTFYNIASLNLMANKLYFTMGADSKANIKVKLNKDNVISLKSNSYSFIPQQQINANSVTLFLEEHPENAAVYTVENNENNIQYLALNYARDESKLSYANTSQIQAGNVFNTIPDFFEAVKKENSVNELWKWFVIFALVFLLIEVLLLKFFK